MPRVLLLLFALCSLTMIFITRCGISFEEPEAQPQHPSRRALESISHQMAAPHDGVTEREQFEEQLQQLIRQKEAFYKAELARLEQRIANLQAQLQESRHMASEFVQKTSDEMQYKGQTLYYKNHFKDKLDEAEILNGVQLNNEYELIPFCRFTLSRLYLIDPGLGKRVVEKPIGFKKKELTEVVTFAIDQLNEAQEEDENVFTSENFLEGIYRTEPGIGSQYELYFRDVDYKSTTTRYKKVSIFRPYGPLQLISKSDLHTRKDMINLILPLSGRVEKFRQFMERFVKVCIHVDKRVFLTVVYFGMDGLNDVKNIIGSVSKSYRFKNIKLITLNESFSRGRGLQIGAQSWIQGDVLLFLCDVDIVFSTDFLERCRLNAKRGERVYYPIVFSLYNPQVVYSLQDVPIPPENEQLIISKDTGFWRDFGYGMTCQYRSDLLKMKGFDETIQGWGMEDVLLYRKYVKSEIMVIRATDPSIFHLWHDKYCDPKLQPDQYKGCIRSKALNEASHAQLGMLAFKDEIDEHKALMQMNQS
ncbi:hypothetical protein LSH36_386g02032 [Paralvinella palmiformis]|uniref:Hexosyltransferase n=1 Tax=Paralvinella palmiformis TaxID=53620 RepID=A0AAD9JEE6_9ANNE|nr:hypothetical protein LSH36_386g02032 [Paralvinella palmiformis]